MQDPQDSGIIGWLSFSAAALGLFGQGCCCVPFVNYLALVAVPCLILLSLGLGALGFVTGSGRALSLCGVALGLFDLVFLVAWYGGTTLLLTGLAVGIDAAHHL